MPSRWAAARFGLAIVLGLLVGGCTIPQAEVGFDGTLEVFGASAPFSGNEIPDDWVNDGISAGRLESDYIHAGTERGTPVLSLSPANEPYVLVRRTNAFLLASPFLRWSWNMTPAAEAEHPVRVTIGFFGGPPESASRGGRPFVYLGQALPVFDRVLTLVWGDSALERGFTDSKQQIVRYVVRGGAENAGRWWTDSVDLSEIYRRAWPKDAPAKARIVFVGFAVTAGDPGASGKFADIVLFK